MCEVTARIPDSYGVRGRERFPYEYRRILCLIN